MNKKIAQQLETIGEWGFLASGGFAILLLVLKANGNIVWFFVLVISISALLLAVAWSRLKRCTLRGIQFTRKNNPIPYTVGVLTYYLIGIVGVGTSVVRLID